MFKYFSNLTSFYNHHPSSGPSDTGYIISENSATTIGDPGIPWDSVCFIESEKLIWTHGEFFCQKDQANWNETNSSSTAYIQNKPTIPSIAGLATESYVNTKVAGIVNSAPETLDTLNELATALGNDPNFATTVSTEIGTKVSKTELSNQSYVTTTVLSNQSYVTQTFLSNQGYLTSFTEIDPVFSASAAAGITSTNISTWNGKQDAISDLATIRSNASTGAAKISANNSTISIQKGGTAIDSFTTNASSAKTINIPNELPSYSSSDSGKVLSVNSSGQLVWITPVSIYTGNSNPINSLGIDGDIYVQS